MTSKPTCFCTRPVESDSIYCYVHNMFSFKDIQSETKCIICNKNWLFCNCFNNTMQIFEQDLPKVPEEKEEPH